MTQRTRPKLTLNKKPSTLRPRLALNPKSRTKERPPPPRPKKPAAVPKNIEGSLEIQLKINELPEKFQRVKRGWYRFWINHEGNVLQFLVRPRVWQRLEIANEQWPLWGATIKGKIGGKIKNGFCVLEPLIQVYEKKPKVKKEGDSNG